MKSPTLDLFWVEKIKITQTILNSLNGLSQDDLLLSGERTSRSVVKSIEHMIQNDRRISVYLPLSMKLSLFLPFSRLESTELENELTAIRDLFDPPALPVHLSDIIARRASELDIDTNNPTLGELWKAWRNILQDLEILLEEKTEEQILRYRYLSWRGAFSIPAIINHTATHNYMHYSSDILNLVNKTK